YTITKPNPNETWLVNAATLENVGIVGVDFVQFTDVTVAVGDLAAHLAYTGTDGDDSLDGAGLDDTLEGGGGNDTINGLAGNDLITGGAGDDSLNGGEGSDTVDGGAGNDTLVVQGNYADYVIGLYGDTGGRLLENAGTNEQIFISDVEFVQFADVSVPYADLALQGTAGNDFLVGSTGDDVMHGLAGDDILVGKEGDDTIDGGEGYDSVYYAEATAGVNIHLVSGGGATDGLGGSDVLRSIEGILGSAYDDTLTGAGTAGGETFEGYGGNDSINGQGGGMDWVAYSYSPGGVNVDLAAGTAADGWGCTDTLAGIEAVRGSADDDTLTGDGGANRLEGQDGSDSLYGGGGNDTLDGGTGSNFIDGGAGVDTVVLSGTQGNFEVYQYSMTLLMFTNVSTGDQVTVKNVEFLEFADGTGAFSDFMSPDPEMNVSGGPWEDNIVGAGSNDMLHGNDGNDTLDGQGGDDLLDGGAGYDLALYGFAEAGVNVNLATTLATGGGGNDTLTGVEQVNGSEFADTLTGDAAANHFQGLGGNDTLNGGDGNDTLVGGAGSDSIGGGNGIDRAEFWGDGVESGVTVNLATGAVTGAAGNDTLSGIENVVGTDYADSLAGSTLANELVGGLGDDTLNGGTGNDTLDGGEGSDWVQFVGATTAVTANLATGATTGGAGVDLLTSIENAAGSSFNDSIVGSSEGNILRGEAGNDTLNGGDGNDTLAGGAGNDSLVGGSGIDTADYSEATGTVTVNLSVANQTTGGAGNDVLSGIENVRGGNFNDTLTGSTGANLLAGGGGRDSIAGGAGADTLWGGVGNDTLDGGTVSDRVNYSDGNALVYGDSTAAVHVNLSGISGTGSTGTGTVQDGLGGTDTVSNVQFITGSAFDDTITGSGARIFEQIEGGAGNDTLDGGAQNDALNQTDGNSVSYADAPNAVEVNLWDGYAWDGTWLDTLVNFNQVRGSSFDDTLAGTDRTDYTEHFEGRAGSDIIEGYGGFDILRYDNAPSAVSVALETGVANDGEEGLDGFAGIEGVYGSSFDDFLFGGNSSSDALEVFRGGAGNDFIDGGGGFDRVDYASSTAGVNVALADGEYGTASDGLGGTDTLGSIEAVRGSAFNDTLAGAGADFESFEGGAGNDTINGYGGQDIADYDHSTAGVNVNLATGVATDGLGGTDTLLDIESVLGSRLANDTITGGAGNDTLFGQGGNDSLNGGGGNDWLYAGTGVDTVDGGAGDEDVVVVPGAPGNYSVSRPNATDTVLVGGTTGENITLRNVEYVQFNEGAVPVGDLWGNAATTGDDFLTGYEGDDSIDGLAGNDTINGLPGNDTIIGGSGNDSLLGGGDNDLYVVDVAGDQVVENEGEGIDTVNVAYASALTYTLGAFVENAVVTSAAGIAVNLAGNELDNQLTGNTAGNTLTGNDGNDTLNGGAGNDTMIGGAGDDTYVVNVAADVVNETLGGSGTDTVNVSFTTGVTYTLGAGLENALVGNSVAGINLTGNALGNMLEGSDMANILAGGVGNDILSGNSG
ncbi:MAG: beta strand repeat-containing protein, partial [Phycisphaerae bacterium]